MSADSFLPATAIIVIEGTQIRANDTRALLSPLQQEQLGTELDFRAGDSTHVRDVMFGKKLVEPCLVVTDREGLKPTRDCVVGRIRNVFAMTPVILYSAGATKEDFAAWKAKGLVDSFVQKQSRVAVLLNECRKALKAYFANDVLNEIRDSIVKHPNPFEPYIDVDGKSYSAIGLFREVIRGTKLGQDLIRSEKELIAMERCDRRHKKAHAK